MTEYTSSYNPDAQAIITPDGKTNVVTAWSAPFQDLAVWQDLADAIDEVFGIEVQKAADLMLLIRHSIQYSQDSVNTNIYPTGPNSYGGQLLSDESRLLWERSILIMTANLLGFTFWSPNVRIDNDVLNVIEDSDYFRINTFIAQYYPEKGTEQFLNFFGFAADSIFDADTLWADGALTGPKTYGNYGNMLPGTNEPPKTTVQTVSITEGGPEFPTTHIDVFYDSIKYQGLPLDVVRLLAVHLAPINLVFRNIIQRIKSTPSDNGLAMYAKSLIVHMSEAEQLAYLNISITATTRVYHESALA